jgi:hypothetical protein
MSPELLQLILLLARATAALPCCFGGNVPCMGLCQMGQGNVVSASGRVPPLPPTTPPLELLPPGVPVVEPYL